MGKEYQRKDGAEEHNTGIVFWLEKNEEKKVVVGMTIRLKMKGNTIQEKEKEIMTNRDKWAAEINYFAHRLYRAMIWFLVYSISHTGIFVWIVSTHLSGPPHD